MKKYFTYSIPLILFIFTAISCAAQIANDTAIESSNEVEITNTEEEEERVEFTGSFYSVQGVRDDLSCFTDNGGYLTDSKENRIPLLFQDEATISNCDTIKVTGYYTIKNYSTSGCSAQMSGFMKVLIVESFECL